MTNCWLSSSDVKSNANLYENKIKSIGNRIMKIVRKILFVRDVFIRAEESFITVEKVLLVYIIIL